MSTTSTPASSTATTAAVNKAAKSAGVSAAAVSNALPTVVETVELGMEVPAKVVLNQKMIVAVSIVGGAALGAGLLYGVNKFRNRKNVSVTIPDSLDEGGSKTDLV